MRLRLDRLAGEDGIAVVFSIQILAILTLMVVAVLGSALSLGGTTQRDYNSKNALAAALSGLDVARYRLQQVDPANGLCLTDAAVSPGSAGAAPGECPAYSGDLGNGTTYSYYVTPAITGGTCAGETVTASASTSRCVTAVGTSDGVTRRTQALLRRDALTTTLFPFSGLLGLDGVTVNESNKGTIVGPVGSNGTFSLSQCSGTSSGVTWMPGTVTATMNNTCSGTPTSQPPASTAYTLSPLDQIFAGTETLNDNAKLIGNPGLVYDPVKRELSDENLPGGGSSALQLQPNTRPGSDGMWTFNLCKINFTHATLIKLVDGATARFLIDSNQRAGSGCQSGAYMNMTTVEGMNLNASGAPAPPTQLQFFFYGTGIANVNNKTGFSAFFYGPDATFRAVNDTTWIGAIAAKSIEATNGLKFTAGDVSSVTTSSTSNLPWKRTVPGFVECRSAATTPSDPESGC